MDLLWVVAVSSVTGLDDLVPDPPSMGFLSVRLFLEFLRMFTDKK